MAASLQPWPCSGRRRKDPRPGTPSGKPPQARTEARRRRLRLPSRISAPCVPVAGPGRSALAPPAACFIGAPPLSLYRFLGPRQLLPGGRQRFLGGSPLPAARSQERRSARLAVAAGGAFPLTRGTCSPWRRRGLRRGSRCLAGAGASARRSLCLLCLVIRHCPPPMEMTTTRRDSIARANRGSFLGHEHGERIGDHRRLLLAFDLHSVSRRQ